MTRTEAKVLFRAARALPSPLRGCIQNSGSSDFDWLILVCWNVVISSGLTAASVPSRNGLLESWSNGCAAAVAWVEVVAENYR